MTVLLSKTYEEWDEDALEAGDTDDRGYVYEDAPHTFRELIRELRDYSEASMSHTSTAEGVWFSTEFEMDCHTGFHRQESLHFSRNNHPRSLKYWTKAARYVGLIKERR